jgi:RimJ/RimL family protein N-acetyltransferase
MSVARPTRSAQVPPAVPVAPVTRGAGTQIVTLDGQNLALRPITPDDAEALVAFHCTLSDESIYLRYFTVHPHLTVNELDHFTHVDGSRRVALVAWDGERIVGVGRYDRIGEAPKAEVAFVITDAYQGRGIATAILRELARIATEHGIDTFVADTLFQNTTMRRVFSDAGYKLLTDVESNVVHVEFALDPGPAHD